VALYLIVNDIHARKRPPSRCTGSYWPDLLDLLYQTIDIAREREARAVVWAGDVFDHKNPARTDHGLMMDLTRVIQAYPCPLLIVPGNHDIQHDRLDSIEDTQPLGVLYLAGARRLEGRSAEFPHLYGVPWQQDWSREGVREALRGYREDEYAQHGGLIVTHAPIYPPGSEPGYAGAEYTPAEWWSGSMEVCGSIAYGHIHEPHGTWRYGVGEGVTFCNFGALSRGSLDEYNLDREVGCALWDSVTGEFEFVPLKAKPASEVFRLRQRAEEVTARRRRDDFRAGVDAAVLGLLSVEGVVEHIRSLGVGRGIENLAEELLMAQQGGTR
jgi:Calcineurin-like phosphoesterase